MGRKKEFSGEVEARVATLHRAGCTTAEIMQRLGLEGIKVPSHASVDKMRHASVDSPPVVASGESVTPTEAVLRPIRDMVPKLQKLLDSAIADESAAVNPLCRTIIALVGQLAKMDPPVAKDPNESIDMVEAAAEYERKILAMVQRKLDSRPTCRCGARPPSDAVFCHRCGARL